jgi:hypothetical protein
MWTPSATGLAGVFRNDADHVGTDGVPGVVEHAQVLIDGPLD